LPEHKYHVKVVDQIDQYETCKKTTITIKMSSQKIPSIVIGRLPLYLRVLTQIEAKEVRITSSQEMGEYLGISSAQIRKDLLHFGEFGKQGTGYNVRFLKTQLMKILKIDREWNIALVGAGGVGTAIVKYAGFQGRGFQIALVFDNDPSKIGQTLEHLTILSSNNIKQEIELMKLKIAMVAVPAEYAQEVTNQLIEAGIRSILNYAPTNLSVPPKVRIVHIDPVIGLQHMTYYL